MFSKRRYTGLALVTLCGLSLAAPIFGGGVWEIFRGQVLTLTLDGVPHPRCAVLMPNGQCYVWVGLLRHYGAQVTYDGKRGVLSIQRPADREVPSVQPSVGLPPMPVSAAPLRQPTSAPRTEATPAPVVRPPPVGVTVYVTNTGSKYHRAGCQYLRRSEIPMTLGQAEARGYSPCSRCGPP